MLALLCASIGSLESVSSPVYVTDAQPLSLRARLLLLAVSQWSVHVQNPKSQFLSDWWAAQWTAGTGAAVLEPCWGICLSIAAPRNLHFNHGLLTNIYLSIIYLKENQKLLTVHSRTGKEILVLLFPLYENLTHYFVFIFYFLLFNCGFMEPIKRNHLFKRFEFCCAFQRWGKNMKNHSELCPGHISIQNDLIRKFALNWSIY